MTRFHDLVAPLRTPADAERDPGFRDIVVRQTRWGMVLASTLGVIGVAVFVVMQVLSGRRLALSYPEVADAAVVISDDLLVVVLCLTVFAASRSEALVARWGRPLLAAVLVVSATSSMIDDAARGDYSFSIAWAGLMALVVITAVPFRPRQAPGDVGRCGRGVRGAPVAVARRARHPGHRRPAGLRRVLRPGRHLPLGLALRRAVAPVPGLPPGRRAPRRARGPVGGAGGVARRAGDGPGACGPRREDGGPGPLHVRAGPRDPEPA